MKDTLAVGVMSGTSLDGVSAALVRLNDGPGADLIAFHQESYAAAERGQIIDAIARGGAKDLALLHVALGERFAGAILQLLAKAKTAPPDLAFVASHGQTIWHEPGKATLQLGDPAVIAERVGVRVVSDFRARDVAAGGQGAPLVPLVGPEALTGSTRMKAGTATKLVLNTLTTGAMIRLGRCYGNLMVDLLALSDKLRDRGERIVMECCAVDRAAAHRAIAAAEGSVKLAIVMARRGVDRAAAQRLLDAAGGFVRRAVGDPPPVTKAT